MTRLKNVLSIILFLSMLFACSKDDGGQDGGSSPGGNGYALSDAGGHSFQFYTSTKLLFSVTSGNGSAAVALGPGRVTTGVPEFTYKKTGANTATCEINIQFSYLLGGTMQYNAYVSLTNLVFTSSRGGTYQNYDRITGKAGSSGKFTLDDNDLDFSEDDPELPDIPDNPEVPVIPSDAIESKVSKVYEDVVVVDFVYDKSLANKITKMGHCWGVKPHPTVLNSTVTNVVSPKDSNTGYAECKLDGQPGTKYYIRGFALVGTDLIYFNELEVESVGGDIKLSAGYSKEENKIAVDYEIKKSGTYDLCFFAHLTAGTGRYVDDDLGYVSVGKGRKWVTDYSCFYYYAYLKDVSTGITYYSKTIYK